MNLIKAVAAAVPSLLAFCAVADAANPLTGLWQRDSGTARVQIAPCGDKLCGVIVWVRDKDSPTKVGMRVFYDIVPESQTSWIGQAFNPEDQQTYAGAVTIAGSKMTTTGCVVGKFFCKSVYWERVK